MSKKQTRNKMTPSLEVLMRSLTPFFEDNSLSIHRAGYARLIDTSRNGATTVLNALEKEGLIHRKKGINLSAVDNPKPNVSVYYMVDSESNFKDLNILYWKNKILESPISQVLSFKYKPSKILLLDPIISTQVTKDSTLALGVINPSKTINHEYYDRSFERFVQIKTLSEKNLVQLENFYFL